MKRSSAPVSARARYEAERSQGEMIAAGGEEAWGWTSPAGRIRAGRRARFLTEAAVLGPGVRCLELGAGTGEFTRRIAESGCDLVALEISDATAAVCRERVDSSVNVVVGNAETGEGLEGEFDAIVGVSVLHHLDVDACLSTTFKRLRAGGRFAFSEPNMANPQVWAERHIGIVRRRRHVTEHETAFSVRSLREILEKHGLEVEEAEPFDFLHPSTPPWGIRFVRGLEARLEATPLRAIAGSIRVAGRRP
jgi:SAM-dependent methyltransferase